MCYTSTDWIDIYMAVRSISACDSKIEKIIAIFSDTMAHQIRQALEIYFI